ncbi:MAG: hypothetical protein ABI560_00830 [Myxococcales bacterium]
MRWAGLAYGDVETMTDGELIQVARNWRWAVDRESWKLSAGQRGSRSGKALAAYMARVARFEAARAHSAELAAAVQARCPGRW